MSFLDALQDLNRPQIEPKEWMKEKVLELVTEETKLADVINACIESGLYALDLETTGLDKRVFYGDDGSTYTKDKIVGYCLSPDGHHGYYIPVRHVDDQGNRHEANLPPAHVADEMRRLVASDAVAIFHNGKFDQTFLQFAEGTPIGEWDDANAWEDTLILAYLRNTRERRKGLKPLSLNELGMEMIELTDLFSEDQKKQLGKGNLNFSLLDPTWDPCIWYAASDAICTYLLFKGMVVEGAGEEGQDEKFPGLYKQVMNPRPHGVSQKTVYKLEKMTVTATRWMERNRIYIDRKKIEELIGLGQEEWFDSLLEVYTDASKILGRDIRPGWFRLMQGEEGGEKYDPMVMNPTYMDVREEAIREAARQRLDPTEAAPNGKERMASIVKEVPSLTHKRKRDKVAFPVRYDVTIPSELGLLLRELGVQGLQVTEKSGQVKTSKDVLNKVIERSGETFPFMGKIKRFREVAKALGSNLFPIYRDTDPNLAPDSCLWVGFNGHKVDTGRFATPTPRNKKEFHGQSRWNLHSIPATYDKTKPACMLRIREAVRARPDHLLFAIDYSGVELRIVTNLSREPKWLAEFFRCSNCENTFDQGDGRTTPDAPPPFCPKCGSDKIGDLHTLTALSIYGEGIKGTKQFKNKRQKAKGLNFAMCYGGGPSAAQRAVGVDRDEGYRIKRQFDNSYSGLRAWWSAQHAFARKYKYVVTAFGRRYPLPDIDHEMGGFRAKAERNAVNGPVQGTSADITKLAMALLYVECKKRGWLHLVKMTITIHDELVFEIHKSIVEEAVDVITHVMTKNKFLLRLKVPIPLKVDVEFGADWTVPRNLTEMAYNQGGGDWTPELVKMFPNKYAHYLQCGGTPVEGVAAPDIPDDDGGGGGSKPVDADKAVALASQGKKQFEKPDIKPGQPYQHTIHSSKLSYGLMEKLAHLILICEGRGTQPLRLVTELGEDLLPVKDPVMVNGVQFKILAEQQGL